MKNLLTPSSILPALMAGLLIWSSGVMAAPPGIPPFYGGLPECTAALTTCQTALETTAAVPQTGQKNCYGVITCAGTGQDADKAAAGVGVPLPTPRFVDNSNGTVTDKLTGLIWLKNANCQAISPANWQDALTHANQLANGQCGLTDGSTAGDWRLPNVRELQSLINYGYWGPALSNAAGTDHWGEGDAFSDVLSQRYWSSTTDLGIGNTAWTVIFKQGFITYDIKDNANYVWPVRGGQ